MMVFIQVLCRQILEKLCIRILKVAGSIQAIRQMFPDWIMDVQEIFTPTPAYRAAEEPSVLHLGLTADLAMIKAAVAQDGDRIVLTMTFLGTGQEALAGQQVFLRRQGRLIFSAKTDSDGIVRTPRLKPAAYEVMCPGVQTTFQLEVHS